MITNEYRETKILTMMEMTKHGYYSYKSNKKWLDDYKHVLYWHSQLATIEWFEGTLLLFTRLALSLSSIISIFSSSPLITAPTWATAWIFEDSVPSSSFCLTLQAASNRYSSVHNAMSTGIDHSHAVSNCSRHTAGYINVHHPDLSSQHTSQPTKLFPS